MTKPEPYVVTKTVMNFIDMCSFIDEKYGINQRNYAGKTYAHGSEGYDKPYQDFWHYQMDNSVHFPANDSFGHINLQYQLDDAKEDWQREIAQLWLDEYGEFADSDGEIELWVSW